MNNERHSLKEIGLTLEDLAIIVSHGHIESDLQRRLAGMIDQDPRFAEPLAKLEALAADAGADDLWDGLRRNQEFDRLLETEPWSDPAEILNPQGGDFYELSYRKLLAVATARAGRTEDGGAIQSVMARLRQAERQVERKAAFAVAEVLWNLSDEAAERVIEEARRRCRPCETS